ncbi:MAG: nucleotide exchange factor GrpE [Rickettsiales bacterium]|nr:nucleotide exchange factor GrpE [Rickettsiales bacterium]|tara:strand:+ start:70839 stop:71411 length:573 start_codon:yes stop_codon:yes gene_type:complete
MTNQTNTENKIHEEAKSSEGLENQQHDDQLKDNPPEEQSCSDAEQKINELKDQLLRTLAEFDNYKKRSEREMSDMAKYSITNFAKDLLGVADNFGRALDAMPSDTSNESPLIKSLADGIKMTESELAKAFKKHGVEKIDPLNQPFDHNLHQAIMEVEVEGVEAGVVTEVLQSGYKIHDRLLRPAMVKVAK